MKALCQSIQGLRLILELLQSIGAGGRLYFEQKAVLLCLLLCLRTMPECNAQLRGNMFEQQNSTFANRTEIC